MKFSVVRMLPGGSAWALCGADPRIALQAFLGSREAQYPWRRQPSFPQVALVLQLKPLKYSPGDNSPQTRAGCGIQPERDLTHGFWVEIMKIQAIVLNWQPDFLRLPLVKCLVDILEHRMGLLCTQMSLALEKFLLSSTIFPFWAATYFWSGLITCLEQVMNRSEILITRIMEFTKATGRTSGPFILGEDMEVQRRGHPVLRPHLAAMLADLPWVPPNAFNIVLIWRRLVERLPCTRHWAGCWG